MTMGTFYKGNGIVITWLLQSDQILSFQGVACKGHDFQGRGLQGAWLSRGMACKGCGLQGAWLARGTTFKGHGLQEAWLARGVACKGRGFQGVGLSE